MAPSVSEEQRRASALQAGQRMIARGERPGYRPATLTATTVAIQGETCDEFGCEATGDPRDVVVEGTWTAVTPVVRESFRGFRDDGVCVQRDRFSGSYRDASFAGTFDGQPFEAEFDVIRDGKSSFSVSCTI